MENYIITGISANRAVERITVVGMENRPGQAFQLFQILAAEKISVDVIVQSVDRTGGSVDIAFAVNENQAARAVELLKSNLESLTAERIEVNPRIAKLSVLGEHLQSNPGVASGVFQALFSEGVNIESIACAENLVTVLIDEGNTDCALHAVQKHFHAVESAAV